MIFFILKFYKSLAFNNKILYNLISKQNLAYNKKRDIPNLGKLGASPEMVDTLTLTIKR